MTEEARSVPARSETVAIRNGPTAWHHSAIIGGLKPATGYMYRVGDGATWSEWIQFRTAHAAAAPFRFLFFGDTQNDLKAYCTRTFRAAFATAPDSAFFLLAGDLVTTTTDDSGWAEFFYALDPFERETPGLSAVGNHEYRKFPVAGREIRTASPLFRAHFTQPENGPRGLEETTYYVDYQGVRFVTLNGNERLAEQAAWLDDLLTYNPNRWTIVLMHQPAYSTGKQRDNSKLREILLPVYDKHAVDLVLQGHDHSYGRTYKLRAGRRVADAERGTIFVTSAAGPKSYPVNPEHAELMAKLDTGTQLFQVIAINGDTLRYESWSVTGDLHDSFTLKKPAAATAAAQ